MISNFGSKQLFAAALMIAALASSSVMAAHLDNPNLLTDPSFEGTLTFDGPPFVGSWEGFSSGPAAGSNFTTNMPRSGSQSLELQIFNEANQFAGAFQDFNFGFGLTGTPAWFSGWHKLAGITGGSEYRIEWRDSVNNVEISRTQFTDSPSGSDYEEFIIADTIPAGADSARVVYAIQSFGGAVDQQVWVDDVNFNIQGIPEPSTIALVGLAGIGCLVWRRCR